MTWLPNLVRCLSRSALVGVAFLSACEPTSSTGGVVADAAGSTPDLPKAAPPAPPPATPSIGFPPGHPIDFGLPGGQIDPGSSASKPVITGLEPAEGSALGGEIIVIRGKNFAENVAILFGDVSSPLVFQIDETWLNVTTPPGNPGPVDVLAINPDGTEGRLEAGFRYVADLTVTAVTPSEGSPHGGDVVTIRGTGFVPGVRALFGDRLAPTLEVLSGTELTVRTPPGLLGVADVRVLLEGDGVAELEDGWRYAAAPDLESLSPASGPTAGGTELLLTGRYFTADAEVRVGAKVAEVIAVDPAGRWLTARTPGDAAGRVGIGVSTPDGEDFFENAFVYLGVGAPGLTLWNVVPATGPTAGGTEVKLVVTNLEASAPVEVHFGTQSATVVNVDAAQDLITVVSPPQEAGVVQITVGQGTTSVSLAAGFKYASGPSVEAISPTAGSEGGGDVISVYGTGFGSDAEVTVTVGGIPIEGLEIPADGQLAFVAPPCSPGQVDVVITVDDAVFFLPDAYFCRASAMRLLAFEPPDVARSGGALVQVIGTGLPDDVVVRVGGQAVQSEWASPTTLWIRAPRAEVGPLDVTLTAPSLGIERSLAAGLFAFDPENRKAAVWGERIERTVNVTLIDGSSGNPIPGATAILGKDPATVRQCLTDERGQCSISTHGLFGKQTITGAKTQFSAYTIAGFDGHNVTIFLRPQAPPGQQGPPGDPGTGQPNVDINTLLGKVTGRVVGIGKYALPPPPSCDIIGSPDGEQCQPCVASDDCAADLACANVADTGAHCLKSCQADSDCYVGFRCTKIGQGSQCLPTGGEITVRCDTSRRGFFGENPSPGPGAYVDPETHEYEIDGRLGEVTVYCVAGYNSPNGLFVPTIMGIRPTVIVHLGEHIDDADVVLDIPLTRTVRARLFDLPYHKDGISPIYYRHAIDIGAEGWLPMPETAAFQKGDELYYVGYPETLAPFGPDAAYTFYATLNANTSGNVPSSYHLLDRVKTLDVEPVLHRAFEDWTPADTGMRFDLDAVWAAGVDDVWAVGAAGRLVHKGPLGWGAQPKFTNADLHAVWGTAGDNVFVGGAQGTILRFDGVAWTVEPTGVTWTIRGIHGDVAVGDGGILRRDNGIWTAEPVLHGRGLKAVVTTPDGGAVAVGEAGKVLTFDAEWQAELVPGTGAELRAVMIDAGTVVATGVDGTVAVRTSTGVWSVETLGRRALNAVVRDPATGDWLAGGDAGTLYRYSDLFQEWQVEETDEDGFDVRGFGLADEDVFIIGAASLPFGPWMAFPLPVNPVSNEFLVPGNVTWTFEGAGAEPTFNQMFLSSTDGFTVWTVVADGALTQVELPPLIDVIGYDPIPGGSKYFNLIRGYNRGFSIDGYRFNQFSIWLRNSWSVAFGGFY